MSKWIQFESNVYVNLDQVKKIEVALDSNHPGEDLWVVRLDGHELPNGFGGILAAEGFLQAIGVLP